MRKKCNIFMVSTLHAPSSGIVCFGVSESHEKWRQGKYLVANSYECIWISMCVCTVAHKVSAIIEFQFVSVNRVPQQYVYILPIAEPLCERKVIINICMFSQHPLLCILNYIRLSHDLWDFDIINFVYFQIFTFEEMIRVIIISSGNRGRRPGAKANESKHIYHYLISSQISAKHFIFHYLRKLRIKGSLRA